MREPPIEPKKAAKDAQSSKPINKILNPYLDINRRNFRKVTASSFFLSTSIPILFTRCNDQLNLLLDKQKETGKKVFSLSIIFGLSSKTQWLSGLYYADFISFFSPTQLCGGGTTKSNSNELPISVPLSLVSSLIAWSRQ